MFSNLLKTDFFQIVSEVAQQTIIKEDRSRYKAIFDETRKIIADDPIIILSNIPLILNNKDTKEPIVETSMVIYTTHTRRTTTMIANAIHKNIDKFVQMRSIIPNEEYEIMYDMRGLIKLYHIERYKNISIPALFNAIKINDIYYFPPEIELMDIYHKLYSPKYYDEWESLLIQKKLLSNLCSIKGGTTTKCNPCKEKRKLDINNIKLLMLNFLDNENYVLIGKWAHKLIHSQKDNLENNENIQIISENDIEHDYKNIVNYLSSYTNYGIYYKKEKMYIPKDNRIYKYTLFIKYPTFTSIAGKHSRGIDKQFMDIYNCGEFELIPYIPKTYNNISLRVGNLFVQMRFLLIDMWLYRLLNYLKIIDEKLFTEKCSYVYSTIKSIKKILPIDFKNKYMGIVYDEKIAQKITISEQHIKKSSYYPELSIKKDKSYKLVATSS